MSRKMVKGDEISELEDRTKEMKLGPGDWRGGLETAQGPE